MTDQWPGGINVCKYKEMSCKIILYRGNTLYIYTIYTIYIHVYIYMSICSQVKIYSRRDLEMLFMHVTKLYISTEP